MWWFGVDGDDLGGGGGSGGGGGGGGGVGGGGILSHIYKSISKKNTRISF